MISMPSFSNCALISSADFKVRSSLGPRLAFGPPKPENVRPSSAENFLVLVVSMLVTLTQLSHQTKKYDLKSKHCGAQTDLGTTRAKVVEALTEVRRAKIDGPALIFDDQLCELHSSNTDASTSASSRSMPNVLGKDSDF